LIKNDLNAMQLLHVEHGRNTFCEVEMPFLARLPGKVMMQQACTAAIVLHAY
jgi:hypothetical protein